MEIRRRSGGRLSPEEAERLEICETAIDSGLKTFWEVGIALAEVRDKRLWYGSYASFTEYLDKRWHLRRSYAGSLILAADIRMELADRVEERREKLRSARSAEAFVTAGEDDPPPFDLPDSVESACALGKLNTDDRVRVLEELKSRELPASKANIRQVADQILPSPPKVRKLSYGMIRSGIDAIVRQAEFFDALSPDRIGELFQSPGQREQAVEALKKMADILEKHPACGEGAQAESL